MARTAILPPRTHSILTSVVLIVAASALAPSLAPSLAYAQHTPMISAERVAHGPARASASRIAVRDPVSGRIVESLYSDRTGRLIQRRFYSPPPTPDLNRDGVVDTRDLAALTARLGLRAAAGDFDPADLNSDGVVDSADLLILLNSLGESPEPPTTGPWASPVLADLPCTVMCLNDSGFEFVPCEVGCEGEDGLGTGGGGDPDCSEHDNPDDCERSRRGGGGGGGGNNNNNDDDDDDCNAEREPTEDSLPPPGVLAFRSDFGLAVSTNVGWIANASVSMGGSASVTVDDRCCSGRTSPSLAFTYHGTLNGSASFRAGVLPNSRGDIQIPLAGLGTIKADYSYGPQFEASASLFAAVAGDWVPSAPDCQQCVAIGVMGDFDLQGYIGIDFGVEVITTEFIGPWGGTECEPGFTFRVTAMAGVMTGGSVSALYNMPNCNNSPAGLVSGRFQHDEVRTFAVMEFNVHGAQRVVPIGQWDVLPRIDVPL